MTKELISEASNTKVKDENNPYDDPNDVLLKQINIIATRTGESPETVTKILKANFYYYTEAIWCAMNLK